MREYALTIRDGTPSTPTRKSLKMIYSPANLLTYPMEQSPS